MNLADRRLRLGCGTFSLILMSAMTLTLASPSASAQNYEILEAQSEAEKARILRSAINSAGYPCGEVTTVQFNGADSDRAGYWAVACADGGNWMVQVKNDAGGSSSVTPCSVLKRIGVECWEKF